MPPPVVRIRYPSRRDALAKFRIDGAALSLVVPTSDALSPSVRILLDVSFADAERRFVVEGEVAQRFARLPGGTEPGLVVEFHGGPKVLASRVYAYCAGRPAEQGTASSPRLAMSVRCRVVVAGRAIDGELKDLSSSGAFVAADGLARVLPGARVTLVVGGVFGFGARRFDAKIVWAGRHKGETGAGARLAGDPKAWADLLARGRPRPDAAAPA